MKKTNSMTMPFKSYFGVLFAHDYYELFLKIFPIRKHVTYCLIHVNTVSYVSHTVSYM